MSSKDRYKQSLSESIPLDYSFKRLENFDDIRSDKPREGRVGKIPQRGDSKKFLTKALWLDNNNFTSISGIVKFTNTVLEFPEFLSWLDLSFNNIKEIDPDILQFKNLIILYFHGNALQEIDTVFKLRELPKLKRLTLHGNPISEILDYRIIIIHVMPQLYNLDFAPIIKREKNTPAPLGLSRKLELTKT